MTNNIYFIANWKMFGKISSINSINKVISLSKSPKYKKAKIIYCPPYTLLEKFNKKNKKTNKILAYQLQHCLKNIKEKKNIIIAYEPIWSIGTGLIPTNKNLQKIILFIRKILNKNYKSLKVKLLYGGSVNPKNIQDLNKITQLDGYLIGGASQKQHYFIDIIKKTIN